MLRLTAVLAASVALVISAGCDTDPAGIITPVELDLGSAIGYAKPVRDSLLPDGEMFMVSCIDVDDEGFPETGVPWQVYYADPADSSEILIVMVMELGATTHLWQDSTSVPLGVLPEYDHAGPWVEAAKDSLGQQYSNWEEYALVVKGNEYPDFPLVLNVAVLQFMSPDTTEQISVILDSDNDSVLGFIQY